MDVGGAEWAAWGGVEGGGGQSLLAVRVIVGVKWRITHCRRVLRITPCRAEGDETLGNGQEGIGGGE